MMIHQEEFGNDDDPSSVNDDPSSVVFDPMKSDERPMKRKNQTTEDSMRRRRTRDRVSKTARSIKTA